MNPPLQSRLSQSALMCQKGIAMTMSDPVFLRFKISGYNPASGSGPPCAADLCYVCTQEGDDVMNNAVARAPVRSRWYSNWVCVAIRHRQTPTPCDRILHLPHSFYCFFLPSHVCLSKKLIL